MHPFLRAGGFVTCVLLSLHSQCYATVVQTAVSPVNGNVYYLLTPSTWTTAELEAISLGGHLATIDNQAEEDWDWNTFSSPGNIGPGTYLWIGLNDVAQFGTFVWSSGASTTYSDWAFNQPSLYDDPNNPATIENYVQIGYGGTNEWNDAPDAFHPGSVSGLVERVTGDANGDGIVNGQDLAAASSGWLQTGNRLADINGDGIVNGQDLALISSNWLGNLAGPAVQNTAPVPEPSAALLAALGALLLVRRCR